MNGVAAVQVVLHSPCCADQIHKDTFVQPPAINNLKRHNSRRGSYDLAVRCRPLQELIHRNISIMLVMYAEMPCDIAGTLFSGGGSSSGPGSRHSSQSFLGSSSHCKEHGRGHSLVQPKSARSYAVDG